MFQPHTPSWPQNIPCLGCRVSPHQKSDDVTRSGFLIAFDLALYLSDRDYSVLPLRHHVHSGLHLIGNQVYHWTIPKKLSRPLTMAEFILSSLLIKDKCSEECNWLDCIAYFTWTSSFTAGLSRYILIVQIILSAPPVENKIASILRAAFLHALITLLLPITVSPSLLSVRSDKMESFALIERPCFMRRLLDWSNPSLRILPRVLSLLFRWLAD